MSHQENAIFESVSMQECKNTFLQRPRLHKLLDESLQKYALTITAGPGYGKSTAVSSFLSDHKQYTLWLSLTHLDNLNTRIWTHLCETFKSLHIDIKEDFDFPESDYAFDHFIKILNRELAGKNRYYLVLDDFHYITNPTILRFMEKLISIQVPMLCIIIISRKEPPMNTISLFSRNLLARIDDKVLKLTEEETSAYFHQQGVQLLEQAKTEFYQYTEGWFFAAQLVCLSLKRNHLYKTNPFSAIKLDIFSLLETEVFSGLSEGMKQLLLKLSLFEDLPIELVTKMAEEQAELVTQMLNITSFLAFDGFTDRIHVHHLFLDFLKEKHDYLSKPDKDAIYLMVAEWYEKKGYRIDAIIQYEKIGRYDRVADILLTFNKAYPKQTMNFLLSVINRVPDKLLEEKPILRFLYIKFLMNNFQIDEVHSRLPELRAELELLPPTPEITLVLGEIYIHLAFQSLVTSRVTRTFEFIDYFAMAHAHLPEGSKLIQKPYISCGNYLCNVISHEKGDLENYIAAIEQLVPLGYTLLPNTLEGFDTLAEAEFAYFRKDMKKAERCIHQAIRDAHDGQSLPMEINALFLKTRLEVASGKYTKAMDALKQQKQLVKHADTREGYAIHDITTGWFFAELGYTDLVPEWIKSEQQSKEVMTPVTFAADKLVRAKCLLHDNEIYELLSLLNGNPEQLSFECFLFGLIEMKALKAIALSLIQEYKESAKELQEAYELALPNKIIFPFIENGKFTRTMINNIADYTQIPPDWLEDIQRKSSTYAKRLSSIAADFNARQNTQANIPKLSRREVEILTSLYQNLTREEIADTHGLSVNTVRSNINNLYNKLGTNNSKDAVRVAAHFNLLETQIKNKE